nr:hypothetical protein [Plesiomonas shigelloides]
MSIEVVKAQVKKFLSSNAPEVLAIKGDWGVGKTYTWNQYLSEFKSEISMHRYSYVSLFGINSLNDLKFTIFENSVKKDIIGENASIETFKENATSLIEKLGRKSSTFFSKNPFTKGFAPAIESVSFLSLSNTIICLDDMERKGDKLEVKEILGLISLLKEQKKCKVVLLLNENEDCIKDYKKYREKVVDLELEFLPTSEECASTAFKGNDWLSKNLKDHSIRLDVINIRVLKKIQRLSQSIYPLIQDLEEEVKVQVVHSLVIFCWCFYCSKDNENIPTLDYVTGRGYSSLGLGKKEEKSAKEKAWDGILQRYSYFVTDELDLEIKHAVTSGYFHVDNFLSRANEKNKQALASKSEGSFSKAWELYHYSLDNNQEDVINALYNSLKDNAEFISALNLNGTVTLFRDLGEDDKASELIDVYIEKRKKTPEVFNLNMRANPFSGDIKDPEIRKKFNAAWEDAFEEEDPRQVISRLATSNGWNDSDLVCLRKLSTDEYCQLLKEIKNDTLPMAIETIRMIAGYDSQQHKDSVISDNFVAALRRIAGESEINKRRMKIYGIDVD